MNTKGNSIQKVFRNRNFSLLWAGQGVSLLGDQFEMIAAPWLVLSLTNDPLALGTVLALSSIPRAAFMLLGGAISDRFSSRTIMMVSIKTKLTAAFMALLVFTGGIQIWQLYAFALLFGLVGGFFNPAASSIVPHIVEKEDLQAGNALIQGTGQLTNFVGPALAGGLIALFAAGQAGPASTGMTGIAAAFALDSVTFLVSMLTLAAMNPAQPAEKNEGENVLDSIKNGIRFAMNDVLLRVMFVLIAAANLLFVGPLLVGIPVLAQLRLAGGAAAYVTRSF